MRMIRNALVEPHPLDLLLLVSGIMDVASRSTDSAEPSLETLVESFLGVERLETTAALGVIAALTPDDLLRIRIRRAIEDRPDRLPSWLHHLDQVRPEGANEMTHVQRDGDNVMIGVDLGEGHSLTAVVYIDHNLGTIVKDAFCIPQSLVETLDAFARIALREGSPAGMRTSPLDLQEAAARVNGSILRGDERIEPYVTDTWPACRALVEWVVRLGPAGGTDYQRPEWNEDDLASICERFLDSPHTAGVTADDRRAYEVLLTPLIDFGIAWGPGDPLHWSPVSVEIALTQWFPNHVAGDPELIGRVPGLIRAFVPFAHGERGVPTSLTRETLSAVDRWEPTFRSSVRRTSERGRIFEEMLGSLRVEPEPSAPPSLRAAARRLMAGFAAEVGGPDLLHHLSTEPLPDEAFDWSTVPEPHRARVATVLALCDDACETIFDVEHRTAVRRLLAEIAATDPAVLNAPANPAVAAAATCWLVGRANDTFAAHRTVRVKHLMAHLGLTGSVSQTAYALLRATGRSSAGGELVVLGTPDLLVSRYREELRSRRDAWAARLESDT